MVLNIFFVKEHKTWFVSYVFGLRFYLVSVKSTCIDIIILIAFYFYAAESIL